MFAGNDYVIRQLLNAPISTTLTQQTTFLPTIILPTSIEQQQQQQQWQFGNQMDSSNLLADLFNESNNNNTSNILIQDYSLTLQLLKLQLALQQQQQQNNNINLDGLLLAAATALTTTTTTNSNSNNNNINFSNNNNLLAENFLVPVKNLKNDNFNDRPVVLDLSSSNVNVVQQHQSPASNSSENSFKSISSIPNLSTKNVPKKIEKIKCDEKIIIKKKKLNRKRLESSKIISESSSPCSPSSTSTNSNAPTTTTKSSTDSQNPPIKRLKLLKKRHQNKDNETCSPVSGMFIKKANEVSIDEWKKAAELDDTAAYVNISDESRRAIAKLPNVIGDAICFLCKVKYDDVFRLAMHRCPRIIHEEYRCTECDKIFSCPANLASHRRWHRPRQTSQDTVLLTTTTTNATTTINSQISNKTTTINSQISNKTTTTTTINSQISNKTTTNICLNCSMEFKTKSALKSHNKRSGCVQKPTVMSFENESDEGKFTIDLGKMAVFKTELEEKEDSSLPSLKTAAQALISLATSLASSTTTTTNPPSFIRHGIQAA